MNFFKDAINYKNDGYSKAARKYYKQYKEMYEAFSAVNKGNNALEGAEGGKRYSLDIDSIEISQYNEIKLPKGELLRLQSEALTWDENHRNELRSRTLSNGITYRYIIDDEGIVHPVDREIAKNIHEKEKEYDNQNREQLDTIAEELWYGQGNNGGSINTLQNGRKSGKDDTGNNRQVLSEGRSDRAGYSEKRTVSNRSTKDRSELINSTDENYFKALDRNEKLKTQSMIYDASRESMGNPDGQEAAIIIKDAYKKDGSTIDFANAILDGNKKGEVRKFKTLTRKWVGISKDGKVIGRVRFGEPIVLRKGTQEYHDSLIEGTEYDIADGETKYYYPVEEIMDLRDNPRKYYHNKGAYGFYSFKETDAITYDDNGNIIPPSERFNLKNKDRRYSLDIDSIMEQTRSKVHAEPAEAQKPKLKESISTAWTGLQISLTNEQAGIEKIGKKFGIKDIDVTVQMARAAMNEAQEMIGGNQYRIGAEGKKEKQGEGFAKIFEPIDKLGKEEQQSFDEYLLHWHNTSRMSLKEKSEAKINEAQTKYDAEVKKLETSGFLTKPMLCAIVSYSDIKTYTFNTS